MSVSCADSRTQPPGGARNTTHGKRKRRDCKSGAAPFPSKVRLAAASASGEETNVRLGAPTSSTRERSRSKQLNRLARLGPEKDGHEWLNTETEVEEDSSIMGVQDKEGDGDVKVKTEAGSSGKTSGGTTRKTHGI